MHGTKEDINMVSIHRLLMALRPFFVLDSAMPALMHVMKKSDRLTAILFFDGAEPVQGTPFDKEINALQRKYARDLKKAHEPFVLVLAARKGTIFDYTIN